MKYPSTVSKERENKMKKAKGASDYILNWNEYLYWKFRVIFFSKQICSKRIKKS